MRSISLVDGPSGRQPCIFLWFAFLAAIVLSACDGCRPSRPNVESGAAATAALPTARLFLVSDLAGALEPCGCVKDQLGGMDHFGALVKETPAAHAVLSAGPLFFMDAALSDEKKLQETDKAGAIAECLKTVGLAAFAPGKNDWAAGADELARLAGESGAKLIAANLAPDPRRAPWVVKDVGGLKIGFVGVATPPEDGPDAGTAAAAVKQAAAAARAEGAQAVVVSAAVGRGEAKRIADESPDLLAILVGSTKSSGETNTEPSSAERVGDVLIVQPANHLQTVAVLDLYVRDAPKTGLVKFADATGVDRMRKREELSSRIDELRTKIAVWEKDKKVAPADVAARKADMAKLEAERDAIDATPAPAKGSFYRYAMREIREKLGADAAVKARMLAYYKHVNELNEEAFKDKKPLPPPKGEPKYVGIDACSDCHEEPRAVWNKTAHAHAYATLADEFKQYNLDCVACHVTGYDKPGGSTVTHVDDLKDVQCEVCHGPGELHAKAPEKTKVPVPKPGSDVCLTCHHPPHVHAFDPKAKMPEILGPGHGRPSP